MRPAPGEVLHFSEDPSLTVFEPRDGFVWACDSFRASDYWFPRDCPRFLAWVGPETTAEDRGLIDGLGRLHLVEHSWVDKIASTTLYAYRLPASSFSPVEAEKPHAMVSASTVSPLGPAIPVGDLLGLHASAGIVVQAVDDLWPWVDRITPSTLEFSGIRLANALPRKES